MNKAFYKKVQKGFIPLATLIIAAVFISAGIFLFTPKGDVLAQENQLPEANFTFTTSDLTVDFTSTSTDSDGTIASYLWNFGDG